MIAATASGGSAAYRRTSARFNAESTNSPANRSTISTAVINKTEVIAVTACNFPERANANVSAECRAEGCRLFWRYCLFGSFVVATIPCSFSFLFIFPCRQRLADLGERVRERRKRKILAQIFGCG
jgi:hypothetical protein